MKGMIETTVKSKCPQIRSGIGKLCMLLWSNPARQFCMACKLRMVFTRKRKICGGECNIKFTILNIFKCIFFSQFLGLRPHGLQPFRLLCPWNFPGKNTGVSCHFLLQGIILTQGTNLSLLLGHLDTDSLPLSQQESPKSKSTWREIGQNLNNG